ncbi:hypothetical protein B0J11DRAFT_279797 [Dendryphion nanum]|uniref:Rhodopsin domain-containing protein n=1 Tax=Dendryphion nanum TaxID=256645 RepID=A0A9P9IQH4_9PLEO|nr:hypothetical protein B0J11DRAFT_279797 [Dendryphion nanum]
MMADVDRLRTHADSLFRRAGGLVPPSSVVKSWPKPNHVDPETRGWAAPAILIVFAILTTLVFGARIWARTFISKNTGLDDLLMSIAMIPLLGLTVASVLAVRIYGFQWHAWDQTKTTLVTSRQIILAIEFLYIVSTSLIKISILCFYRRITSGSISRTFVFWVWASIIFVICYCIGFTLAITFTCSPVAGYWRFFDVAWRLQNEMKCRNEGAIIVTVVVVSTVQDFVICALPVFLVWNLQISKRQKVALIGIFGLGLLTCVCGIMRTYYAIYVYYYTYDITWIAYYGWIWTALEADLGVICASAPALKVFFRRYLNLSSNRSKYGYGYGDSKGRKTPTYGRGTLGNSVGVSNIDSGRWDTADVPLDRIKVSTRMDVTVVDRDDDVASQKSDASTRILTNLNSPPQVAGSSWLDIERSANPGPDQTGSRERY